MVRGLASSRETSEEAKRFLPPFLDNAEKDKIIQILTSEEDQSQDQQVNEEHLRSLIMGIIRG